MGLAVGQGPTVPYLSMIVATSGSPLPLWHDLEGKKQDPHPVMNVYLELWFISSAMLPSLLALFGVDILNCIKCYFFAFTKTEDRGQGSVIALRLISWSVYLEVIVPLPLRTGREGE